MTQSANLELVRSFYGALERDDFAGIAEWVAPEIELVLADGPEPGSRVGLTSIEEVWREYLSKVTTRPSTNVELVRSILANWEVGDWSSAEWLDPEIEYVIADGPQPGAWKGREAMAEAFREFLGGLEQYRVRAEERREISDRHVLEFVHAAGRGKTSGVELERVGSKSATVCCVRDARS